MPCPPHPCRVLRTSVRPLTDRGRSAGSVHTRKAGGYHTPKEPGTSRWRPGDRTRHRAGRPARRPHELLRTLLCGAAADRAGGLRDRQGRGAPAPIRRHRFGFVPVATHMAEHAVHMDHLSVRGVTNAACPVHPVQDGGSDEAHAVELHGEGRSRAPVRTPHLGIPRNTHPLSRRPEGMATTPPLPAGRRKDAPGRIE